MPKERASGALFMTETRTECHCASFEKKEEPRSALGPPFAGALGFSNSASTGGFERRGGGAHSVGVTLLSHRPVRGGLRRGAAEHRAHSVEGALRCHCDFAAWRRAPIAGGAANARKGTWRRSLSACFKSTRATEQETSRGRPSAASA